MLKKNQSYLFKNLKSEYAYSALGMLKVGKTEKRGKNGEKGSQDSKSLYSPGKGDLGEEAIDNLFP